MLPYFAARCKGVNPFLVVAFNDAPLSIKTPATYKKRYPNPPQISTNKL